MYGLGYVLVLARIYVGAQQCPVFEKYKLGTNPLTVRQPKAFVVVCGVCVAHSVEHRPAV